MGEVGSDIARDYLMNLVLNNRVRLVAEKEDRDQYGRLLRYVYLDSRCINEEMVDKGYAESYFLGENDRLKIRFDSIQLVAYRNRRGLWAFDVFQPPEVGQKGYKTINWRDAKNITARPCRSRVRSSAPTGQPRSVS